MSRQWRSDDTNKWKDGFGKGIDLDVVASSSTTFDAFFNSNKGQTYATVNSGTAGSFSATLTNVHGFHGDYNTKLGDIVIIHQTRGTGAGNWELNIINQAIPASPFAPGTSVLFKYPLQNNYLTSGASIAQVVKLPQYKNFTINSGVNLLARPWDGSTGGILAFFATKAVYVNGLVGASGRGYRGGNAVDNCHNYSYRGEGYGAASDLEIWANYNGGGGGFPNGCNNFNGGGGGGHAGAGGGGGGGDGYNGSGGNPGGNAELTSFVLGGGGGGGAGSSDGGGANAPNRGGYGGGAIFIFAPKIIVNPTTGWIESNGESAPAVTTGWMSAGGGGGGAGGGILLKGLEISLGSSRTNTFGGSGTPSNAPGGGGSVGRIHADYSRSLSGSTSPGIDSRLDKTIASRKLGGSFLYNYV